MPGSFQGTRTMGSTGCDCMAWKQRDHGHVVLDAVLQVDGDAVPAGLGHGFGGEAVGDGEPAVDGGAAFGPGLFDLVGHSGLPPEVVAEEARPGWGWEQCGGPLPAGEEIGVGRFGLVAPGLPRRQEAARNDEGCRPEAARNDEGCRPETARNDGWGGWGWGLGGFGLGGGGRRRRWRIVWSFCSAVRLVWGGRMVLPGRVVGVAGEEGFQAGDQGGGGDGGAHGAQRTFGLRRLRGTCPRWRRPRRWWRRSGCWRRRWSRRHRLGGFGGARRRRRSRLRSRRRRRRRCSSWCWTSRRCCP